MAEKVQISIVSPVYGCKTCLEELYLRIKNEMLNITSSYEIILINDNSPDGAWETIIELAKKDQRVKGINFSRNFGQHYSIAAGLENSTGEWVIVMDCDLQDQPEEISKLFSKANEGWDAVFGRRELRKDKFIKVFCSMVFYKLLGYLTNTEQDSSIANFGIYHRKVVDAIGSMGDNMRYFPTMVRWVGFRQTSVIIEHAERSIGKTSYSFRKLLRLSLDVMLAFSDKPLRLTVKLGFAISCIAFFFVIFFIIKYFTVGIAVAGWTSLILSFWMLSGIIIFLIGIVGLYIGKTFENVKQRPKYIIREKLNFN